MDRLRTLLLARSQTVVLDPDRVASAATRPSRDVDLDRFEDELVQLGYVMSLDLAMTVRRLPHGAIAELKAWMVETLETTGPRPAVPLAATGATPYLRRVMSWLATEPEQPCPWCGQLRAVGALDPCGHLVCPTCWSGGTYAGCPICHRRIAMTDPFVKPPAAAGAPATHDRRLRLLHLAFDAIGTARERLTRMLARPTPLDADERAELETVIDVVGPKAAIWLPARIPMRETMAIALARLWLGAPDRIAMMKATEGHLGTATDVLRVAVVLMGGEPALRGESLRAPRKLRSIARGMRRAVLEALDRLAVDPPALLEDVMRHAALWKRVGERLHPFEHATRLPNAALAFAAVRGTDLATTTFGNALAAAATQIERVELVESRLRVTRWARVVEDALRAGDARTAASRLGERPAELIARVDHLVRIAAPDALAAVLATIGRAITAGAARTLLVLGAHVTARTEPWPRRVFVPAGAPAWVTADDRPPLPAGAIATVAAAVRSELLARAETRRQFARAVLDRVLADVTLPFRGDRAGHARPTVWDVACIHAAARANIVYIRERDGRFTIHRRRDGETALARLARLHGEGDHDGQHDRIPPADAPTLIALMNTDLAIPRGSAGYVHARGANGYMRLRLVGELAPLASSRSS